MLVIPCVARVCARPASGRESASRSSQAADQALPKDGRHPHSGPGADQLARHGKAGAQGEQAHQPQPGRQHLAALDHRDDQGGHGERERDRRQARRDTDRPEGQHRPPRRGDLGEQPGVERSRQCVAPTLSVAGGGDVVGADPPAERPSRSTTCTAGRPG